MLFNILKTIHIFSVIAWMAGLLYLPRIFVYHSDKDIKNETSETFKIMEKKLFNIIMMPAFIVTWISGLSMVHYIGFDTWLILKIFFVVLLTIYHFICRKWLLDFANDNNKIKSKFFRITNEIPAFILILIIILVVFKPF
ncbi:protoporphyrinogen oxidase HemJ [Alphaproteobacteria bacterium]|nr:protoporphyrinogen oxidase HemJ [Alphaproteobacteria bacterium]MDC0453342.1 protoporphyrinogen oxidase HemJ [Alphaproteobacteria bacterium]MDC0624739.1 protoporphyrinogen oxidase HemJ [Alphaproteobacteria bacterium]